MEATVQTLPVRQGPRPATTPGLPHSQLDQQATGESIRRRLAERVVALPGVSEGPTRISVPGARALPLDRAAACGPAEAFFIGGEFAHLHPGEDQSLHVCLPPGLAAAACEAGWAESHPLVASAALPPTHVMVYAPRNEGELNVVASLVEAAYRFATGQTVDSSAMAPSKQQQGGRRNVTITGFRHAGLTVTDLERSVAWYADVLGFKDLFRATRGQPTAVIMGMPTTSLLLGLIPAGDDTNDAFTPFRPGLDHLCFAGASRE